MKLPDLHAAILVECAQDDVQLCNVVFRANGMQHYRLDENLPEGVRHRAIETVRDLLQEGLILAGFPPTVEDKEQEWTYLTLSPEETIHYIESEWDKLGRPPSLGEIIWFKATEAGKQLAQEILLSTK